MDWIYFTVENKTIQNIQSNIFSSRWKKYGYEIETNPHITIIPGFNKNRNRYNIPNFKFSSVNIGDIRFYPNKDNPMVVMLDVSDNRKLSRIQSNLADSIGRENINYELHPFHITLFKSGDSGEENKFDIPKQVTSEIHKSCEKCTIPDRVHIHSLQVDSWSSFTSYSVVSQKKLANLMEKRRKHSTFFAI